jgi:hypothetical protein
MSNPNSTIKMGGVSDSPLQIFQPMNVIVFLPFFSPIILAVGFTSMSFIFQNFKGLIYLGFLIGCCFLRSYVYMVSGADSIVNDKTICTSVQYSKYGNPTFSAFVFAFTLMYVFYPMFANGSINFWIFTLLIAYFIMDIFIKLYKKCVIKVSDLFLNILLGATSAALIVTMMYAGGSGKYLFFNEMSSDKQVCYKPSNQTFKCSLYKDGTIISEL